MQTIFQQIVLKDVRESLENLDGYSFGLYARILQEDICI